MGLAIWKNTEEVRANFLDPKESDNYGMNEIYIRLVVECWDYRYET